MQLLYSKYTTYANTALCVSGQKYFTIGHPLDIRKSFKSIRRISFISHLLYDFLSFAGLRWIGIARETHIGNIILV